MAYRVSKADFAGIVQAAIEELPERFIEAARSDHPARCAAVSVRQVAAFALMRARTTPCCVVFGLTGMALVRLYWP